MGILLLSVAMGLIAFLAGYKYGRVKEKDRVRGLLQQASLYRYSPSLRWVWHAHEDDLRDLMPEAQFFGERVEPANKAAGLVYR